VLTEGLPYVVCPPVPQDAEALGRVHCRVWQVTYADSMSQEAYAALSPERFARGWTRRLGGVDERGLMSAGDTTMVAEHPDDGIVGFICVGPARDDDAPTACQLWAINLVPEHQGTGVAQRLMAEVLRDGPAYLWVAKGNERAIRFYQRHDFAADGAENVDRDDGIPEIRMVRRH